VPWGAPFDFNRFARVNCNRNDAPASSLASRETVAITRGKLLAMRRTVRPSFR